MPRSARGETYPKRIRVFNISDMLMLAALKKIHLRIAKNSTIARLPSLVRHFYPKVAAL